MGAHYKTDLVKNCVIPMSDGVTLAADLYRPATDQPSPALLSFYPYHKDDDIGPGYFEGALRALAQAGYACLLVDVRGTGNSGGSTGTLEGEREHRDYYETVEWAAEQEWCSGKVGVWGLSYGSMASLLTAAERPPHLQAVAAFHGAGDLRDSLLMGGRPLLLSIIASWSAWMAGHNYMPPGYRDPEGRWLSVWREHLESTVPHLVTAVDALYSGQALPEPSGPKIESIQCPVYLWVGWHDIFPKLMVEAYQSIKAPKKMTIGPWVHVMPDVGHAGDVDYLHELQRWFGYWLRGEDTGIMDEPPVAIWVQGDEAWVYEEDYPPPEVERAVFHLGPEGTLSESVPGSGGTDSFEYDATVGVHSDLWDSMGVVTGLPSDQRFDELKGITYTTSPFGEDMEICGVPEAVIQHASTVHEPLVVAKLCDVSPDGRSTMITAGWLDVDWAKSLSSSWGEVLEDGASVRLSLIPTCYVIRAGHRLRLFLAGSNFPCLLPNRGSGQITIGWGSEPLSLVRLPVRPPRSEVKGPAFLIPQEIPHVPVRAPMWRIEQNPLDGTVTVRMEYSLSLGIDGGEGPATVSFTNRCCATASERGILQPSAHAESEACWENERESIEVHTVMAFRPVGLDLSVNITLNGVPYWQKRWSRSWPEQG